MLKPTQTHQAIARKHIPTKEPRRDKGVFSKNKRFIQQQRKNPLLIREA